MTLKDPTLDVTRGNQEPRKNVIVSAPLLSTPQLAAFLGVPVATIYAWRYKGHGPCGIKVGRYTRYRQADVDGWLREQEDRAS